MKGHIRMLVMVVACVGATLVAKIPKEGAVNAVAAGGPFSESQTFDTEAAVVAGGWAGFNTTLDGNTYGFSNTDFTGGTSPAGEAGGTIARTAARSFYGDLAPGGGLALEDAISAAGEFTFVSTGDSFNNNIQIGHFDPSATILANTLGIMVAEPHNPAANFRITAFISLSNGGPLFSPPLLLSGLNVPRTWSYSWDPTAGAAGVLTATISGPDGGTVELALNPAERAIGAFFSAFGLSSGGGGEPNADNTAILFIDNVSYTVANEPGQCEEDLAQCESALTQCLANVVPDQDGDGEADATDDCPNTPEGAAVDQAGCSLAQFCAAIDATTAQGAKVCKNSDWRNDNPLAASNKGDCKVKKGNPGRADDLCVPRP